MTMAEEQDLQVDVWMPLYPGDYLRDTQGLSTEEHGAYLLLMMTLWMNGGFLPLDHRRLARIARADFDRWPSLWQELERYFHVEGDRIWQKRNLEELEKAREQRRRNLERSQKANDAKRAKRVSGTPGPAVTTEQQNHQGHLQGHLKETSKESSKVTPSPSPSPSPSSPPPSDPEGGVRSDRSGDGPTPHDVLHWFGLAWRDRYQAFWTQEHDAVKLARDLLEDMIGKAPADQRSALYADIKPRIGRFLASADPFVVSKRHTFRLFVQGFNALALKQERQTIPPGFVRQGDQLVQIPTNFPRAKTLP